MNQKKKASVSPLVIPATTPTISRFELGEPDVKRVLHGFAVREQIIGFLVNAPRGDAIGAAVAFLIKAAQVDPAQMRAVLNAQVNPATGTRVIDTLTNLSR